MTTDREKRMAESITGRLFENVSKIKYGQVAVSLRVHSGRIVDVIFTITESMREAGAKASAGGQQHEKDRAGT